MKGIRLLTRFGDFRISENLFIKNSLIYFIRKNDSFVLAVRFLRIRRQLTLRMYEF